MVTVIIPTLNEERVIGLCLSALGSTDFLKSEMEVIVVDNGSRDQTVHIARSFEAELNLRIFEKEGVHISALRNLGVREARGSILAFLDADCLAPKDWLKNVVKLWNDARTGVTGAHYQIPNDATWVGRVWHVDRQADRVGEVSYVPSGDLIVSRNVFSIIGGWDESIQTNEDYEFCQRARAAGFPVRSDPSLRVIHLGTPRTLRSFYRKQRWHGTHVLAVFLRDLRRGRNLKPVLFAIFTFACLIGSVIGVLILFAGGGWKVATTFLLALVLPLLSLAAARSAKRRKWGDIFPLALLYLIFGLGRAACLLDFKAWRRHTATNPLRNP